MTMHPALAAAWDSVPTEYASDRDELIAWKIRALLVGYHYRWISSGWTTIFKEEVFHLPIVNPATGRSSRTHTQAGVYDGIIEREGKRFLLEQKTSSEDISDPNSAFWRRTVFDSQVSMYVSSVVQQGSVLDGTVYDAVRKPSIRPKSVPVGRKNGDLSGTQLEILEKGTYYGVPASEESIEACRNGTLAETPALYYCRLARDTLAQPDKYYQRRIIPRLREDLIDFAHELWDVSHDIRETSKNGRHYRNSGACMPFGTPCEYISICAGESDPDGDQWKQRKHVHTELGDGFGASVLTNSRIKTYQTCRRKHYFRYLRAIEKVDGETKEALYFGSMWHVAQEHWWNYFLDEETENGSEDEDASEHQQQGGDGEIIS